jgi:DNA-binding response OmpR family regulator
VLLATTPRVLLADPSSRMRRILRINLEGAGCQVTESTGQDLPCCARQAAVDALVINLDVRTTDVCEAVHALRRRNPGAVVAGYSILPPDDTVRRLCIDMYVEKPFDLTLFVARLRGACARVGDLPPGPAAPYTGRDR